MADQVSALLNGIAIGGVLGYAFALLYTFKRVDAIAQRLREAREELARLKLLDRLNAAEAVGEDKVRAERDRRIHATQEGEG